MSRITFVGEFGAGKSSVINTLLHVVSGSSPDEFAEAAPTGGALGSTCICAVTSVASCEHAHAAGRRAVVCDLDSASPCAHKCGLVRSCIVWPLPRVAAHVQTVPNGKRKSLMPTKLWAPRRARVRFSCLTLLGGSGSMTPN